MQTAVVLQTALQLRDYGYAGWLVVRRALFMNELMHFIIERGLHLGWHVILMTCIHWATFE